MSTPDVRRRVRTSMRNGAQGRDRTTDTAIFSRMLYQLSYLGTSSRGGLGAAVYSQGRRPCPPRFAFGYAWRSHAIGPGKSVPSTARRARARLSPQDEDGTTDGRSKAALTARNHTNIPN